MACSLGGIAPLIAANYGPMQGEFCAYRDAIMISVGFSVEFREDSVRLVVLPIHAGVTGVFRLIGRGVVRG